MIRPILSLDYPPVLIIRFSQNLKQDDWLTARDKITVLQPFYYQHKLHHTSIHLKSFSLGIRR